MRNLRKLGYYLLLCTSLVYLLRLTLQKYCNIAYSVDATLFGGCVLSALPRKRHLIHTRPDKSPHSGDVGEEREDRPSRKVSKKDQARTTGALFAIGHEKESTEELIMQGNENILFSGHLKKPKRSNCVRRILFWAEPSSERMKAYLTKASSKEHYCRGIKCTAQLEVSMAWEALRRSDVVIFQNKVHKDWPELIKRRPHGQIWIFYTRESPAHMSDKNNFPDGISQNVHNLTKLYLSGSDIMAIYGRFVPNGDAEHKNNWKTSNWSPNKTKLCAWVASNCKFTSWDRMGFVKSLQEHMPVDIYGKCGDLECPDDCRNILPQYRFYLALESHTCRDYITEKVWRNSFEQNVIPVVFGAPKIDYEKILPPKSFIHVEDFNSFNDLAKFLREVAEDEEKYNSYFEWRAKGTIKRETASSAFTSSSLCEITKKVVAVDRGEEESRWADKSIKEWWQGSCFNIKKPMVYR